MLLPISLGLCRASNLHKGHEAAGALTNAGIGIAAGGALAWLVYRNLGLKFVSRSWFNLDASWAFSLVLVGTLSLAINIAR
jgi:hypothetical protein